MRDSLHTCKLHYTAQWCTLNYKHVQVDTLIHWCSGGLWLNNGRELNDKMLKIPQAIPCIHYNTMWTSSKNCISCIHRKLNSWISPGVSSVVSVHCILHCSAHCTVLHCTAAPCNGLCQLICHTSLHCIVQYCIVLTIQYCNVLYYTTLYLQYIITLLCTIHHCSALYNVNSAVFLYNTVLKRHHELTIERDAVALGGLHPALLYGTLQCYRRVVNMFRVLTPFPMYDFCVALLDSTVF